MLDRRHRELPGKYPAKRSSNRRAFPRWPGEFEVRGSVNKKTFEGVPHEISEGGLSFSVDMDMVPGTLLDLEYRLLADPDKWTKVRAVVRHNRENRVGVEFLNLKLADRLKIVDYVGKPVQQRVVGE